MEDGGGIKLPAMIQKFSSNPAKRKQPPKNKAVRNFPYVLILWYNVKPANINTIISSVHRLGFVKFESYFVTLKSNCRNNGSYSGIFLTPLIIIFEFY